MLSWRIFFLMPGTNYHFHSIVQMMIAYECRCANSISTRDEFSYFIACRFGACVVLLTSIFAGRCSKLLVIDESEPASLTTMWRSRKLGINEAN
jgi:hypothetical protein